MKVKTVVPVLVGLVLFFASVVEGHSKGVLQLHKSPKELPVIKFVDETGHALTLSHWKGKIVLLNVWATWCPPCRKEMPTLDRLQAKMESDRFDVIALSIDRAGKTVVRKFYNQIGIKHLTLYVDPSMTAQRRLKLFGLPGTLLIGPDGKELTRRLGPAEWDAPELVLQFKNILRRMFDGK